MPRNTVTFATTVPVWLLLVSAAIGPAEAQQYVISTVAGGLPVATPAPGLSLPIGSPQGVTVDTAGNAYFFSFNSVFKLDQNGIVTRVAGDALAGYLGDGGPAPSAQLASSDPADPRSLTVDGVGNLFIADGSRIRRVSPDGIITTVAGNGISGFSGDGGPATAAQLDATAVAVDGAGNLFVAGGGRIRKVSPDGIITTVAGNGTPGFSGDGGPATAAQINPEAVTVDTAGNLFIAEQGRIRKVSRDGIVTTVAGNGKSGFSGDGGPATIAELNGPQSLAVDNAGNLFIGDRYNYRLRKLAPSGIITTVAGNGTCCFSGDGGPATAAQVSPVGVAVDGAGNLFLADYESHLIRKVSVDGIIIAAAGNGGAACCFSGDGGPSSGARLNGPTDVAVDANGNIFVADAGNRRVRKISPTGIIDTVAGNGTFCYASTPDGANICPPPGDGGPAIAAQLNAPLAVAVNSAGDLLIADPSKGSVRKVSPKGIITTVAGGDPGPCCSLGDGGPSTGGYVGALHLATDAVGNLFLLAPPRIRKVSPDGVITTVAGNGLIGFSGDGGPATSAALNDGNIEGEDGPNGGIALDGAGNLFLADTYNYRVREVSASGIITTVAGNGACCSHSGDGGPAGSAALGEPRGLAFDGAGNLFLADSGTIRKISPSGVITTVAGNGNCCSSGDSGAGSSAALGAPRGLALDGAGNIYFADTASNSVRVLRQTNHSVVIGAVVDAASQKTVAISPGKIVVIYGAGLGSSSLNQSQPKMGQFSTELGGTTVSFNGTPAPLLYASDTQVAAIVPYSTTGTTAEVTVTYHGDTSGPFFIEVAPSTPSLFTSNQTGAGQAAAINADGTVNTAASPVKIGSYISLFATGEGQTSPAGLDGKLGGFAPILPVKVTIGGISAAVQYAGGSPGQVSGLMQVNVQIPNGVQPGGYVPVILQVGAISTTPGAVWIAVSGN